MAATDDVWMNRFSVPARAAFSHEDRMFFTPFTVTSIICVCGSVKQLIKTGESESVNVGMESDEDKKGMLI